MLSNLILLLSVVALLFPMGFFALATPPLLILKHDTPLDGRFVRGMFHHYYAVIIVAASAGAVAHAVLGRITTAFALGGVAAVVFAIRRWFLPRMDALREPSPPRSPAPSRGSGGCMSSACCSTWFSWAWWALAWQS